MKLPYKKISSNVTKYSRDYRLLRSKRRLVDSDSNSKSNSSDLLFVML